MIANRRAFAALAAVLLPTFVPVAAYAQSEGLAQTLFDEGLKLMDEGKYAAACPKLAESQKLDPGGGTLINLALCREKEGKLASAWAAYNEALSQSIRDGRKEREGAARERLAEITPKLAKLTIVVPPATMVAGLEVRFDDSPVPQAAWGVPTPVDVGKHHVSALAPGKKPLSVPFEVKANGEAKSIEVPPLFDATVEAKEPGNPDAPPPSKDTTAAWVVGGVGAAGVVVGAITGIMVFSKKSDSDQACKPTCTQAGVDSMNSAYTLAWVSDISLGAGLVGLGVSAILFLTAKSPSSARAASIVPMMGPGMAGLQGRF